MSFNAIRSILLFMIFIIEYISQFLPKADGPESDSMLPDLFVPEEDDGC